MIETLSEVHRLRARGRALAHGGAWFPVAVLAALVLASIALYRVPFRQVDSLVATWPNWAGLPDEQRSPVLSYAFWFIGTPLALALIAAWYRWRANRVGVRVRWRPFGITALVALAALALLAAATPTPAHPELVSLHSPGTGMVLRHAVLTPLLPIAASLVVLGVVERSRAVALAGAWVALITCWQTAFGQIGHLPAWVVWILDGGQGPAGSGEWTLFNLNRPGPLLLVIAAPLVVFAAVRAWRTRGGTA